MKVRVCVNTKMSISVTSGKGYKSCRCFTRSGDPLIHASDMAIETQPQDDSDMPSPTLGAIVATRYVFNTSSLVVRGAKDFTILFEEGCELWFSVGGGVRCIPVLSPPTSQHSVRQFYSSEHNVLLYAPTCACSVSINLIILNTTCTTCTFILEVLIKLCSSECNHTRTRTGSH